MEIKDNTVSAPVNIYNMYQVGNVVKQAEGTVVLVVKIGSNILEKEKYNLVNLKSGELYYSSGFNNLGELAIHSYNSDDTLVKAQLVLSNID